MHIYIYDDYVTNKKYEQPLIKIETRITDLGLSGKIIRLGMLKNIREAIIDELRRGAKTIVAVGSNKIFNTVINAVLSINQINLSNLIVPVALIPVGNKNIDIAKALGLKNETIACDVLSARRIENLNIVRANDLYFLSQASIETKNTILEIDQSYSIEINEPGLIRIINLPLPGIKLPDEIISSPTDNDLELIVYTLSTKKFLKLSKDEQSQSMFNFSNLKIINTNNSLVIDNSINVSCPVEIKLADKKLPVIVGKDRRF